MDLVEEIYRVTNRFPFHERFGLVAQMRRAAVSVPSNIAEGAARDSTREFGYFLSIARGSLSELETQVEIAFRTGFLKTKEELDERLSRVGKLLTGLHKKTRGVTTR